MYYTREDIEAAKKQSLIKLLEISGYKLKKEKENAYKVLDVDGGLYIFDNGDNTGFYWHKNNLKGNAIDFCKIFFNDIYLKAITRLLNYKDTEYNNYNIKKNITIEQTQEKKFIPPKQDDNIKCAYSYLINTRKINKNIINKCIKNNLIKQYTINNYTNVGFVGYDKENKERYLMLRSTGSKTSFKREYINSSKKYGFKIFNKETINNNEKKNIHIFESPIDLLSYISLYINTITDNDIFLAMGGTNDLCLEQFIKDYNPLINKIIICFDNDFNNKEYNTGQENAKKLQDKYKTKYNVIIDKPIYGKDFNEELKILIEKDKQNNIANNYIEHNEGIKRVN